MACGNGCTDDCSCCFDDGIATTARMVGDCWVFDVKISSDPCNHLELGSDGGLLVKECAQIIVDQLCDDVTDPATPFERRTFFTCDGSVSYSDFTPLGVPYLVTGNVVCCGGGGGSVTEEDLTNNSQVIPSPVCEGVLSDAGILRELPIRWDVASQTYRVFDDGRSTALTFEAPWNGTAKPTGGVNTPTGYVFSTPVSSIIVNNPSSCRPAVIYKQLLKALAVDSNETSNPVRVEFVGYYNEGAGFSVTSINNLSSQVNAVGQIDHTNVSMSYALPSNIIPPGGSITFSSYSDATYVQGNSAGGASNSSVGYGQIKGILVTQ